VTVIVQRGGLPWASMGKNVTVIVFLSPTLAQPRGTSKRKRDRNSPNVYKEKVKRDRNCFDKCRALGIDGQERDRNWCYEPQRR
jgi:hypothetical protein